MSGTKGHSGRRRKATCARNGRVYVALDMVRSVTTDVGLTFQRNVTISHAADFIYYVDGTRFDDYAAAAAEFVRRVNGAR